MRTPKADVTEASPAATFSVDRVAYLGADAVLSQPLPDWAQAPDHLLQLLHGMVLARRFDARAVSLQRTGRLGTYATALGQEAVPVGVADAMRAHDVLLPTYREAAAQYARGVSLAEVLLYWGGDERGSAFANCAADFPPCIPVGSQLPHAAGVAFALKQRGEGGVAVTFVGDGGTSKGDFYEAINIAGAWALPMVVVINNNQWAISVSRQAQTAADTLAQKAIAAGIPGMQVDGNDVIAVRDVTERAIQAAIAGQPCVIEAVTYRLGDHTTADDASRYRPDDEVDAARAQDPVTRLRRYLQDQGALSDSAWEAMEADCQETVEQAVEDYENTPPRAADSLFEHLYAELPVALARQQAAFQRAQADDGDGHGHGDDADDD